METTEIIRTIQNAIGTTVQLTQDTTLSSLPEWDSLAYLCIVTILNETYGVKFTVAELKEVTTIGDLLRKVSPSHD